MVCFIYRWRLRPGMEAQFKAAWSEVTAELLRLGSFGSRLHLASDGTWVGYAQWPSAETRTKAFEARVAPEASRRMAEAVAESFAALELEIQADYLVSPDAIK